MKRFYILGWFVLLINVVSYTASANKHLTTIHIAAAWLPELNQSLTVSEIATKTEFTPITEQGISLGFRDDRIWLKIILQNTDDKNVEGWLDLGFTRLSSVKFYQPGQKPGQWQMQMAGLDVPIKDRALANRNIVFPIQLNALEQRTVYFLVASPFVNLKPTWWSPEIYQQRQNHNEFRDLLVFGATLGLASLGFLQALASRDALLAINALRALTAVVWAWIVMGYAGFYNCPNAPQVFAPFINLLLALFLTIQLLLVAKFLPASLYPSWLRTLFCRVAWLAAGVGCISMVIDSAGLVLKIISLIGSLMQPGVLYACFITARRGYSPAWWLLTGFSLAVFGFYRKLLEVIGFFPVNPDVDFMALLNTLISTVLFYLGTAARVDKLRMEREHALQANMVLQRETEARLEKEVKLRTAELEVARDDANKANQAKTLFLAKVSHELRSPMHTILSYAELARREHSLRHLHTISDAGRHLLGLIDDLLAYVKNSYEELKIDYQAHFTRYLLEQLQAYGQTMAVRGKNELLVEADPALPTCIKTDSRRLLQIGIVLLSNAGAHTRQGRIILRLTQQGPDILQLQVQDNGTGIDPERIEHIFQPFERIDSGSHSAGLGLGLAIALQLAKAMGGELFAQSELGCGSVFTLRLPLIVADPAAVTPFIGQNNVIGYRGKTRRILVVDDNPDHLRFMVESLEAIGFEVYGAATAETLLGYATQQQKPCDLVLLDFHLSDATADTLLPKLRRLPGCANLPVTLISASPPSVTDGFTAVLSKPAAFSDVLEMIARILAVDWVYAPSNSIPESATFNITAEDWEQALSVGDVYALENLLNQLKSIDAELAEHAQQHLERYDFTAVRQLLKLNKH